jgi:hypothetical protein
MLEGLGGDHLNFSFVQLDAGQALDVLLFEPGLK